MQRALLATLMMTFGTPGAFPQPQADSAPEVARLLAEVIRIDTSNPPGNEAQVAEFLKSRFDGLGFEIDILPTPQAGKSHFVARLRGDGSKRPVLIAGHADVVGVEREKWSVEPFGGLIKDGYVWGRGAIDFKGGLAVFAQAVIDIARSKRKLARDIIFLAEADEEGGSYSTRWLAENHWSKIDCEFALNEGGWIIKNDSGPNSSNVRYVSISTADKGSISLQLRARGTSTHSSMPQPDNAIFILSRALAKISAYDTKPRLTESTRQFFLTLSETSEEPMRTHFRNLATSRDEALVAAADRAISRDTLLHAIMRNTIAPVLLNAGFRGNVIPGSADATINFRVVPGTTAEELIEEMKRVIDDSRVEVTVANISSSRAQITPEQARIRDAERRIAESPRSGPLYDALVKHAGLTYPGAKVTPYLFQAGTDAAAWRMRGVPVYGIYPYPITAQELERMHGNDERVAVDSLVSGLKMITATLLEVAGK